MKRFFRKNIRFVFLFVLLLALAFATFSASMAAESRGQKAMKYTQDSAASLSPQGSKLTGNFFQQDPPGVDPELIRRMRENAQGGISVSVRKGTGVASFVRASEGGDLHPAGISPFGRGAGAAAKARGFLENYGQAFGIRNVDSELAHVSTNVDSLGATHVTYQQVHNGVPVFGGVMRMHLDGAGRLTAANGVFVPDVNVDTTPNLSPEAAADRAIADVLANPSGDNEHTGVEVMLAPGVLGVESSNLFVYQAGLTQGVAGPHMLVYQVVVSDGGSIREFVFVNAHNGKVVNRYSGTHDALFRRLFEQNTNTQVWQEGDPFPGSLNADQQNIVNFSGDSYRFFSNAFGVDSYDGAGSEMQSVNNDPRINCPNANWNGITTNYCNGVTSDDVVAHEWGHAYTDYTHDLIYQWQSGALNESYSDIWGEVIDMINGVGTDSPATVRTPGICSAYTTPIPTFTINSPASLAGDYAAAGAAFGPPLTQTGVTGNVVVGDDGVGSTSDGCEPFVNGAAVAGNLALVDRGVCAFTIKVKNAQDAGAIGVVVANNAVGAPGTMGGADPTITIPSVMVTLNTGNLIKAQPAGSVNATLRTSGGVTEDSYRWLMGEDSTAFGGAIRDMWNPNCLADPGKVSDSQYHCATTDGGGVHTNSGVPNHGFALLVDGGTYNGQTINPIGMVKAAHLYWRAASVYQTPTSNFADHADALEASCQDLIGVQLEGLSTGAPAGPSGEAITASDCGEVSKMIEAVELRLDPSEQCEFTPVLQPGEPQICAQGKPVPVFKEDFKHGLRNWTLTSQGVYSGWPGLNWMRADDVPEGHNGPTAFAPDPIIGNCDAGAGDISGFFSMESPAIKIPPAPIFEPHMVFTHYVATESGWDGGNLKISINGGPYIVVPSSAYTFNPYNTTLQTAAAGNTNPLAGEPAFSGTDGGQLGGSWGQSQINLAALGVEPGDTIRLRYDFGVDGCNGLDGWYVDDVQVVACRTN